ncbi:MAG: DUF1553 domain-containing protein [Planctomycetota bacterium]
MNRLPGATTLCKLTLRASLLAVLSVAPLAAAEAEIEFNRDIRPLLSDKCFQCHGPDDQTREAGLRLDTAEGAFEDLGGYAAFVPNNTEQSEALVRIHSDDEYLQMPPPESNLVLTDEEKAKLTEWVRQGAPWKGHWAFDLPKTVAPPVLEGDDWSRTPIDRFVYRRLRSEGLQPAADADPATLLRRVTLDLTGLPPTREEYEAFLTDPSDEAYERVVDRLLKSDAHAERLALEWLDVARYADSHGLHADGSRNMWRWRDWVIDAFRRNTPYDEFVTLQLAGDLLEEPTRESRLATAFHRNHPMTGEGGVINEEFRWNNVFDRTETTATAFLGLTVECSRCHDHKFDPLSHREYFQLASFFNNVRELGMTGDDGDYGPLLALSTDEQTEQLAGLDRELAAAAARLEEARESAQPSGEEPPGLDLAAFIPPADKHYPLDGAENVEVKQEKPKQEKDDAEAAEAKKTGPVPTYIRLDEAEELQANIQPDFRPGIAGEAAFVEGEYGFLKLRGVGVIDTAEPLSAALWVYPETPDRSPDAPPNTRVLLGAAGEKNQRWRGWELYLDLEGRPAVSFVHGLPDNQLRVRGVDRIPNLMWSHVAFAYDGSARAGGVRLFVNGREIELVVEDDALDKTIYPLKLADGYPRDPDREMRIGRSQRAYTGDFGVYKGGLDDLRFFDTAITAVEAAALYDSYRAAAPEPLAAYRLEPQDWAEHRLARDVPEVDQALRAHRQLLAERIALNNEIESVMVMQEMPEPRQAHILERGLYNMLGDPVQPGVPEIAGAMADDLPRNRLGLARWLFNEDNPLTARVAVNRYWQLLFGRGIVGTPDDFGTQGEQPTHPELLDWLALRFHDSGWDVRELMRVMVLSSAYRQSSSIAAWQAAATPDLADAMVVDPENRLLWRGASYRLPGEAIRNAALAASGLLVRDVGGPSVKPYQPEGLWIEKNNFSFDLMRYVPDEGHKLYRRSMYTFIRRTSPPPAMETFDVPNRSRCTVKREVTNTPLQALVLMNDPQFIEAARVLALGVLSEGDGGPAERIAAVFHKLTGREPNADELTALTKLHDQCHACYTDDASACEQLLAVGDSACPEDADKPSLAALAVVANTVMNYDAFYMKR